MMTLIAQSSRLLILFSVVLGAAYPVFVTGFGQSLFPEKANGSQITFQGKVLGSELIAQKIESPGLFHPRPSASDYGTLPSGASNLGATSSALQKQIAERQAHGLRGEMLYASASGLDPHLGVDAALRQIPRIVESRKLGENDRQQLTQWVRESVEKRELGFLGTERVNVMKLNLKVIETYGR